MERREVFPARRPVANACQALPGGNLRLHKAGVTPATVHSATRLSAALVSAGGSREVEESQQAPSSNSFPVEILMTHNHVFNTHISCRLFDVVGWYYCFCFVFPHTTKKNKYYFVRFVLPPQKYFEVFDKLPHFNNGSCVCTLFLLTFYYFCEILHLLLLYR